MVWIRGSRHDYDNWEKLGCTGWSYANVLPYFIKVEDVRDTREIIGATFFSNITCHTKFRCLMFKAFFSDT